MLLYLFRFSDPLKMLPTSHHLAFAAQYITLSGVLLLRCVSYGSQADLVEAVIVDASKCVKLLEGMEGIWNGAKRCGEIVSDLLVVVKARHYGGLSALDAIQMIRGESRCFILFCVQDIGFSYLTLQWSLYQLCSAGNFPRKTQVPRRVRYGGFPFTSST